MTDRRVVRTPRRLPFVQRYQQFLMNKLVAEAATKRNEGENKDGLKAELLAEVMATGERDPESGSFFLTLPEPLEFPEYGVTYTGVKAERRAGTKSLNIDRAKEWLEENELLDEVEEFQYVLRMDAATAEVFGQWLAENDMTQLVVDTHTVFIEDKLLALHHRRVPDKPKERVLPEKVLDGFYDQAEDTWAFVTIKGK